MEETAGARRYGVAVVIPTHNRVELLEQTLRSVAEQTLEPAEVIVVDDASTDATAATLERWDVTTVRNPGAPWGPARARNEGLDRCDAQFVAFLDSDDILRPEALKTLGDALAAEPAAPFSFGRALAARKAAAGWHVDGLIAPDERELNDPLCSIFSRNSVPSPAALVRREAAAGVGGYDPAVTWAEDQHFWVRLAQRGAPVHVPEVLAIYRLHDAGRHYTPRIRDRASDPFLALAASDPRLSRCAPERLGVQLCEIAVGAVRARRPATLASTLWHGLAVAPRRRSVARRALRHRGDRRRWRAAGAVLWETSPGFRSWLASY